MLKLLLFIFTYLIAGVSFSYAENIQKVSPNATLIYEQCNIGAKNIDNRTIQLLGDNTCVFIFQKGSVPLILAKEDNFFGITLIGKREKDFLKNSYYRGEKIDIYFEGIPQLISSQENQKQLKLGEKYMTLSKDYQIVFLSDTKIGQKDYKTISHQCSFTSYHPNCKATYHQQLIQKIDTAIDPEKLTKQTLLQSSKEQLQGEQQKIKTITQKISLLKKNYLEDEDIILAIEYIQYKLDIYNSIIQNRIGDLVFQDFLIENNLFFIKKTLAPDLYISQNQQFTFFYYKDKKINTLNNDTSHFDQSTLSSDPELSKNQTYLQQKIRDKYSAEVIPNTDNMLISIKKTYSSREKYLLFDIQSEMLFELQGNINHIKKGKKGWYMILEDYTGRQSFSLYNSKHIQEITTTEPGHTISNFTLLSGGKVHIFYTLSNGSNSNEVIDVSSY